MGVAENLNVRITLTLEKKQRLKWCIGGNDFPSTIERLSNDFSTPLWELYFGRYCTSSRQTTLLPQSNKTKLVDFSTFRKKWPAIYLLLPPRLQIFMAFNALGASECCPVTPSNVGSHLRILRIPRHSWDDPKKGHPTW